MTFKNLKKIVYQAISKLTFTAGDDEDKKVNRLLTGCLLLKILQNLISISSLNQEELQQKAEEYSKTYRSIAETMKTKFVTYKKIKEKIISFKLDSFLQITEKQVGIIQNLYENKSEIKEFSTHYFSQYMYQVSNLSVSELNRLSRIHFKVICPIMKHYMINFSITSKDIALEASGKTIGSEIKFNISGIPITQIYSDLMRNITNVKDYIYEIKMTPDNFIKIYIK